VIPCNRFCNNKDTFDHSLIKTLSLLLSLKSDYPCDLVPNQAIHGVPKIKEGCNPATWMLDVSSAATEVQLKIDFAEHYRSSTLYQ